MDKANEGMYIHRRWCRPLSLMLLCLMVSFTCGIVYSRGNRTSESEKKTDVGISHQKENKKENLETIRTKGSSTTNSSSSGSSSSRKEERGEDAERYISSNGKWKRKCVYVQKEAAPPRATAAAAAAAVEKQYRTWTGAPEDHLYFIISPTTAVHPRTSSSCCLSLMKEASYTHTVLWYR